MAQPGSIKLGAISRPDHSGGVGPRKFRPKKRLAQHFLVDPKVIHKILMRAGFRNSDWVLEIGPGRGALTLPLARSVQHIVAVEKDARLVHFLQERLDLAGITNVTVINHDILEWDFREIELPATTKIKVAGNLPYNISSPVLEKLIESKHILSKAILMFQLELAKRLTASPGRKSYGAMTLAVQYHAQPRILLQVSKDAFRPKPKVDSMVLALDFDRPYPTRALNEENFKKVLKGAFAHRRKTILNSLKADPECWDRDILLESMEKCGIDPARRAETLTMDEFLCFSAALP